jgi:hypothetical protein
MGELSDALEEFQEISREYYGKIMKIMQDKYCWKCPMRSTSAEALCQELDAWIRLTEALEGGIREELQKPDLSLEKLEMVVVRFLEKKMNTTPNKSNELFFQLEHDAEPFAQKGEFLRVNTHQRRVKENDLVLLPRACPLATYWYLKTTAQAMIPFKIFRVSQVFSKKGVKYIRTEDGLEVPVEFLIGWVVEIIGQKDLSIRRTDKSFNKDFKR